MKKGFCQICGSHVDPPKRVYCSENCLSIANNVADKELRTVAKQEEIMDRLYALTSKHNDLLEYQETVGQVSPETIKRLTSWFNSNATNTTTTNG